MRLSCSLKVLHCQFLGELQFLHKIEYSNILACTSTVFCAGFFLALFVRIIQKPGHDLLIANKQQILMLPF